ncbi:transcriptional regulator [Caulobacter sp. BP25]|nr:transcriptional regulator [Caulobacter sp. BP25]
MRIFYIRHMSKLAFITPANDVQDLAASAHSAARLLKLLASEQRLLILCRLIDGEASVGDLASHVGLAQSATSQHLAKMRAEGLVATRREAQTIFYRLADPAAVRVLETLCDVYRATTEA